MLRLPRRATRDTGYGWAPSSSDGAEISPHSLAPALRTSQVVRAKNLHENWRSMIGSRLHVEDC